MEEKVNSDVFPLHHAAQDGDLEQVKHFIKKGLSDDTLDNNEYTPLHWAAIGGHLEIVKYLMDHKNCINPDHTAVLLAAENKHKNVVAFLLSAGLNGSACSKIGKWTLLHHACRGGWTDIVKRLVENKSTNLDALTTLRMSPMLVAAFEGHSDVVELLLEAGAKVNFSDENGTVLHYASKAGWHHIVKKITDDETGKSLKDSRNKYLMTPLLLAACEGHTDVVQLLLEAGAEVNALDDYPCTALHHACKKGWLQIVQKLLENESTDINAVNGDGDTPLHVAWSMHNCEIVKELLKAGADVEVRNNVDRTFSGKTMRDRPLFGDVIELQSLMRLGLSIESRHKMGYRPLHCAAELGSLAVAKFLISNNCNLDSKADGNETPLLVAAFHGKVGVVDLLIKSGADISCRAKWTKTTILHTAIKKGWVDIVKCILKRENCNMEAKTDYGWTPLMYAVDTGNLVLTKLLLEAGANVHGCDEDGETALHLACNSDDTDVELVRTLLLAGADPNLKNSDDETAFHYAVEQEEPCLEVIKLLIEHRAYFRYSDNVKLSRNNLLKELVLKDVDLCTQLIINKFNRQSLPAVYTNLEFVEQLPRMYGLNIGNTPGVKGGIEECVQLEIGAKTFCNVMKVRPPVLKLMCVESLLSQKKTKKKKDCRYTHKPNGPVKRSSCLAELYSKSLLKKIR